MNDDKLSESSFPASRTLQRNARMKNRIKYKSIIPGINFNH